jgi:Fe-S oxidoreductase
MSPVTYQNRKTGDSSASACVRGQLPSCGTACPLNLDVRQIIRHMKQADFTAAYKAYRVKAIFPEIVANICDEPCKGACVRRDLDESISLRLLERACVDFAVSKTVPSFNLPRKMQRIAVIGAGLSGLTCAVKLASKNYPVTIYEKSSRMGGRLWDLLDADIFLPAIRAQLDTTNCDLRFETRIAALSDIEYDAAVVATGEGGEVWDLLGGMNAQSFGTGVPGVFVIGNILGTTPVEDIAQGAIAGHSVEKFIKVGGMDGIPVTFRQTRSTFAMDLSRVPGRMAIAPGVQGVYDEQAACAEADRCLMCDCTVCSDGCELFSFTGRMPKEIVAESVASLHTRTSVSGQYATRVLSSCNLCGLCGKTCPQGIDMGQFCSDFRVFKHEDGMLPPAFHDFVMRDMQFANNEAYLARAAPGRSTARYLFFPGCQLAASDPRYVEVTYHHLLQHIPDLALILGCCGAPAEWAAETALRDSVVERLTVEWERFGKPDFVFACPTCKHQFKKHMPEIQGTSLYDLLLETEPPELKTGAKSEACVFDPCSSRYDESMQRSVRQLAERAGISLTELHYSGEKAQCCGWGGHIAAASPKLFNTIVQNRSSASPLPYVTYCANCQEVFSRRGKASRHILEIVLGLEKTEHRLPSLGQRRTNRIAAKRTVLKREWGLDVTDAENEVHHTKVAISEELLSKMYDALILEEDVYKTIDYCETSGNVVYDSSRDVFIGHLRIGIITYWVEYTKTDEGCTLTNVYSHRVEIVEH